MEQLWHGNERKTLSCQGCGSNPNLNLNPNPNLQVVATDKAGEACLTLSAVRLGIPNKDLPPSKPHILLTLTLTLPPSFTPLTPTPTLMTPISEV